MSPIKKKLLHPGRVRQIPSSGFSWLDRRFITDGFAAELPQRELLLYLFLCVVADQQGLSFYGDQRLSGLLKLSAMNLDAARRALEKRDLILYRHPLYQVLSLPDESSGPLPGETTTKPSADPSPVGDVVRRLH